MTRTTYGLRNITLSLAIMVGAFIAGATSSSCDSVDAAFDCQAACSKYKDCIDNSFDVGACRDRCRGRAAASDSARQQADACESCIDDRACPSATVVCGGECGPLIAP